ncbi:helix-turn-helix domain-containing protein [Aureimonas glaciei]|uniref:Uncharacterized protein n=1 Tax=Aureimonas glaciei TaxID=1776957 RepID=A0A917DEP9_9HYPH|nr:helix-turn-helix domain-containing protein [Aureimonas glaciei]GGD31117.1 hypothetical protein GCM10011335_37690 [Aureimonas glaciei]
MSAFTPAIDALITKLLAADLTPEQIGAHLQMPAASVMNRAYRLCLREKISSSQREAVLRLHGEGTSISRIVMRTRLKPISINRVLVDAQRIPPLPVDPEAEAIRAAVGVGIAAPVKITERSKEFLEELAKGIAAGETQTAIASRLGVDHSVVHRTVHQHGLVEKKVSKKGCLEKRCPEIESLIAEGLSDYAISKKLGSDLVTLRRAIERMGLGGRREYAA